MAKLTFPAHKIYVRGRYGRTFFKHKAFDIGNWQKATAISKNKREPITKITFYRPLAADWPMFLLCKCNYLFLLSGMAYNGLRVCKVPKAFRRAKRTANTLLYEVAGILLY